ncbi:hypothetical protein C8F01DRAFT_1024526 [Mycena amicta]|nr:hypothetical protein C8F01DRAFT_1024526 [Mycena amicta]
MIRLADISLGQHPTRRDAFVPLCLPIISPRFFPTIMDAPLHPPLRVTALSSEPLTNKKTQKQLELFLQDFRDRSTAAQGGQSVVTVQVDKLCVALKEEREELKAVAKLKA